MIPLPKFIEFEISSFCNRTCEWCPNSQNDRGRTQNYVDPNLWKKFLKEMASVDFNGWLALHNYNEPLAAGNLIECLVVARDICPTARIAIYTNGDLLNNALFEKLKTFGVLELRITLYPLKRGGKSGNDKRVLNLERRIHIPIRDIPKHSTHRGHEIEFTYGAMNVIVVVPRVIQYSNRAGLVSQEFMLSRYSRNESCHLPSQSAAIDYLGNLKLCCQFQDVSGASESRYNIGNIRKTAFTELWNSEKLMCAREQLRNADFRNFPVCSKCNYHDQ